MPLDPQAEKILTAVAQAGMPPLHELSPTEARQQMLAASRDLGVPDVAVNVEHRTINGPQSSIGVRIYRPGAAERCPLVVFLHGGGWVIGSVETHDGYCRALADASGASIVSVEYRLAPEHPYPAAAEDAFAATQWAHEHAEELGAQSGPVIVAGDSAGGNLAAVVALMARDREGPPIAHQILIYPITDYDLETSSYQDFASGYFLTRDAMRWFWDHYCPDGTDRSQAYLSPLRATLNDLPAAHVLLAECDPLYSEGEAYAAKLASAGVAVVKSHYEGMIHGFIRRFDVLNQAHLALREVAGVIREIGSTP